MPTSELSSVRAPPLSLACSCGKEMKLVSMDARIENTVYAYECESGHQHEIITTKVIGQLS